MYSKTFFALQYSTIYITYATDTTFNLTARSFFKAIVLILKFVSEINLFTIDVWLNSPGGNEFHIGVHYLKSLHILGG